ncbi:uncharacterized protein LOC134234561 [Saccostrea cucullata]|uniref:uncharacterized protein LOC134234561 n=1 Tax=Saccostrea cuccullata TaxID=36930 RepID=UPI002ED214F5
MADTTYVFQVRSVTNDMEGDYSEQSDPINIPKSLSTKMLSFSIKIPNTDPVKYQLAAFENREARNPPAKTRQLFLGNLSIGNKCEKTIMLVGATRSGKSTLVDGIINYILGVRFEDPFRFTLVSQEHDEMKTQNQAESPTEWIIVYKITPQEGSRLDYTLNIIDTPGFGDRRGIQRDKAIVDQIRLLFSAEGTQGVAFIDAVCLIVKAPDARLTAYQTYIFHSIMSMLGKDIQSNICTLITFAEGNEPPVLSCLRAANIPFGSWFPFNNSALFASNKNLLNTSLSYLFWEMGCKSFKNFFEKLKSFKTKSVMQTKEVLKEKQHLQLILINIQPLVNAGLLKLNELQNTIMLFKKHQNYFESNKKKLYEKAKDEKMKQKKYLEGIEDDTGRLFNTTSKMMYEMSICKNRLEEIALRPDPLSNVEQIDLMIKAEEMDRGEGLGIRIRMLNEVKQLAKTAQRVQCLEQNMQIAKDDLSKLIDSENMC